MFIPCRATALCLFFAAPFLSNASQITPSKLTLADLQSIYDSHNSIPASLEYSFVYTVKDLTKGTSHVTKGVRTNQGEKELLVYSFDVDEEYSDDHGIPVEKHQINHAAFNGKVATYWKSEALSGDLWTERSDILNFDINIGLAAQYNMTPSYKEGKPTLLQLKDRISDPKSPLPKGCFVGDTTLDGKPAVIVFFDAGSIYYLRPEYEYKPCRIEEYDGLTLSMLTTIEQQKDASGFVFPKTIITTVYDRSETAPEEMVQAVNQYSVGKDMTKIENRIAMYNPKSATKPITEMHFSISELSVNKQVDASVFEPQFPRGVRVSNHGAGISYVVGEFDDMLDIELRRLTKLDLPQIGKDSLLTRTDTKSASASVTAAETTTMTSPRKSIVGSDQAAAPATRTPLIIALALIAGLGAFYGIRRYAK